MLALSLLRPSSFGSAPQCVPVIRIPQTAAASPLPARLPPALVAAATGAPWPCSHGGDSVTLWWLRAKGTAEMPVAPGGCCGTTNMAPATGCSVLAPRETKICGGLWWRRDQVLVCPSGNWSPCRSLSCSPPPTPRASPLARQAQRLSLGHCCPCCRGRLCSPFHHRASGCGASAAGQAHGHHRPPSTAP